MGLTNLGNIFSAGAALPTLSLAPGVPTAEGTASGGSVGYALTLVRNGFSGTVNYAWAVIGSGVNPASAGDFAGGAMPSGGGSFAPGDTSRTITVPFAADSMVEADENFTLSVTGSLVLPSATATGTILNDDIAPPPALLMGSRFNQNGYNGYAGSNGTDTDSNSRIGSYNETGATVTKLRGYFTNWFANATNEQDGYNPITVSAAIEYPAGTVTPLTFGGTGAITLAASGAASLGESDEATLATPIPAGALYWVRTYVSVASGGKWPQAYLVYAATSASLAEAADFSTGIDRTAGATITNATPTGNRRGYGPTAIKATGFTGTPVGKAFAAVGDSIVMGSTDSADPAASGHGNVGYVAKAAAGSYPLLNLGIAGTQAVNNLPANFPRRGALLAKIGVTHVFSDWAVNDVVGGRTAAQIAGDIASIAAGFKSAISGVKVVWTTLTPRTTSTDGWKTVAGQTVATGGFAGGTTSVRSQVNAALRRGIAGVDMVFDAADAAETARDSGLWRAGEGSTHLTASGATSDAFTSDGLHPSTFSTSAPGLGGVYVLRDAVRSAFASW